MLLWNSGASFMPEPGSGHLDSCLPVAVRTQSKLADHLVTKKLFLPAQYILHPVLLKEWRCGNPFKR